jgi:hypothetical protein
MDPYYEKVEKFNARVDYDTDVKYAGLLLNYCMLNSKKKNIFFVGTGLGGDIQIIKGLKNIKVTGIEPRESFQEEAEKSYKKIGGKLLKMNLGEFTKISESMSGIFLFIHSINHIPNSQINAFQKTIKNSYIIVVNPNPEIERVIGKVDKTVISYLDSKKVQKLLNSKIIFDFFYNSVKIKGKDIFLRETFVLKTKN